MTLNNVFNTGLSLAEYRLVSSDELSLEDEFIGLREIVNDNWAKRHAEEIRLVLIQIDDLKINGTYDTEVVRLWGLIPPHHKFKNQIKQTKSKEFRSFVLDSKNFSKGLISPNLEQRKRFRDFYEIEGIGDRLPKDCTHIFAVMERAEGAKGRPAISPPWRNISTSLDAVRLLDAGGMTIPEASRAVAKGEGGATIESRAHRYEGLYRQRMKLRL